MALALLVFVTATCDQLPGSHVELVRAIPTNAAFIIKISDPANFQEQLSLRPYQNVVNERLLPEELIANHNALKTFLLDCGYLDEGSEVPLLASLHLASADKLNSIHYYPLDISRKTFNKLLDSEFPGAARQKWNYEGVDFNEVLLTDLNIKLTAAYSGGILITSPSAFLVEDAVKQLKGSNTLLADPGFKKVYKKETDEADANIWMPFSKSELWLSLFASAEGLDVLSSIENMASWMMMDIYLNEDEIFLSGITSAEDGTKLNGLKSRKSCSHILDNVIPFNTAAYFHHASMPDSIEAALRPFGIGGCWSKILVEPLNTSLDEHMVYIIPISDDEVYQEAKKDEDGLESILSRMFLGNDPCSFRTTEGFIAFSTGLPHLENYVKNISGGKVLTQDETFQALKGDMRTDAALTSYIRTLYHRETFNAIYETNAEAQEAYRSLKGFNQLTLQFSPQGDIFLTNATLTFNEDDGGSHTNLAWSAELSAPVLSGPSVIPLDQEGNMGVLVQDTDFNLYLLDKSGNKLWTREMESRWMGSAFALDLFEDSKNVIALNSETNWHLLNAEGEDMAGFPLHFKDRASAPMSVIASGDEYRVFIPSKNGNLYGYELSGKPLPGWNPKEKTGVIRHAPLLTKDEGDIYVTAINETGMAYIWDEKGKRQARNAFGRAFPSDHFIDLKANPFKIKNVMQNGELVSMNVKGKVGRYKLPVSSINQFAMANVRGNSDPEIILSNGSSVWLFSYTGSLIWKKNIRGQINIVDLPKGSRKAVAVHNESDNTFQLLNSSGSPLLPDAIEVGDYFHLTSKDLLGSGQTALITSGTENEVFCYRVAIGE